MIVVRDSFIGANGTALAAHMPDQGGPWQDDTPGWQIQGNHALQTADNCDSAVYYSLHQRTAQVQIVLNLNGCDPANSIEVGLVTNLAASPNVQIDGTGQLTFGGTATAPQVGWDLNSAGLPVADVTKDILINFSVGPDYISCAVNGVTVFSVPRTFPKVSGDYFTKVHIECLALNALPGCVVKSILVTN